MPRKHNPEGGAHLGRRVQFHRGIQQFAQALDDGKAEPETARHAHAGFEPLKFLEHRAPLAGRNADTGIVDLDA